MQWKVLCLVGAMVACAPQGEGRSEATPGNKERAAPQVAQALPPFSGISAGIAAQHLAETPVYEQRTCIPDEVHGEAPRCHLQRIYPDGAHYLLNDEADAAPRWWLLNALEPTFVPALEALFAEICQHPSFADDRALTEPLPFIKMRVNVATCVREIVPDFQCPLYDRVQELIMRHYPRPEAAAPPPLPEGFILVRGGEFTMGSPADEPGRGSDEIPTRTSVAPFLMQRREVTQGQWQQLMGNNPSHFATCGAECPVEQVSAYDAMAYANALSARHGLAPCYSLEGCTAAPGEEAFTCADVSFVGLHCPGYRLPTETEWAFAARAGSEHRSGGGDESPDDRAWHAGNAGEGPHAVGTKAANPWHLHDLLGNVAEWCWVWPTDDRAGFGPGSVRVRGGSWQTPAEALRVAARTRAEPQSRTADLGFRLVRRFGE